MIKDSYLKDREEYKMEKYLTDQPELLPALTLAYIGDGYYELVVRNFLLGQGLRRVDDLHKHAIELVCATTQAQLAHRLQPCLNQAEETVLRRGRNAKGMHIPKGATVANYRLATGLEALVGYWYLSGDWDRLDYCFKQLWQLRGEEMQ